MKKSESKIIMGVDPGTNILGYCVIHADKNTIKILVHGVIALKKTDDHFVRLQLIFEKLSAYIRDFSPVVMAVEAPFFGKNVQSMLKLGRAQGAAIIAGMHNGLEVVEYSPRRIKQSITGKGNASKEQVAKMLMHTLQLHALPKYFDETDALAVAVCHHHSGKFNGTKSAGRKKTGSWEAFIKANPEKIAKQ